MLYVVFSLWKAGRHLKSIFPGVEGQVGFRHLKQVFCKGFSSAYDCMGIYNMLKHKFNSFFFFPDSEELNIRKRK